MTALIPFLCLAVSGADVAYAQDFPNKTIRILAAAAGGGSDFTARLIASGISGPLGQPLVVENRPSIVAAETLSKSPPDSYTLQVAGGSLWISPLLQKMPYEVMRDFSPICLISREVSLLGVHPSMPAKSVMDLIALAKSKPGELNNSSATIGSSGHLAGELFKSMAGVSIVRIPYKGDALAVTALMAGEAHMTINDAGLIAPHAKSGRLRVLAVTSAEASALAPGVPTMAGSGLPGYESVGSTGLFAPGKTSDAIIRRVNQEVVRTLGFPDVKEKLLKAGSEVVASSPEQFAAILKADIAKWGKVIKDAGIRAE